MELLPFLFLPMAPGVLLPTPRQIRRSTSQSQESHQLVVRDFNSNVPLTRASFVERLASSNNNSALAFGVPAHMLVVLPVNFATFLGTVRNTDTIVIAGLAALCGCPSTVLALVTSLLFAVPFSPLPGLAFHTLAS